MALTLGGRHAEAEAAFTWLAAMQRPDGSWHQYYLADRVEQDKLDANVCAYVAAGVWHRWLCTEDRAFAEALWPVVEKALDFVLGLQTPRAEILWARSRRRHPWSFALLTGSSSICHSLRCGIALAELLGHERPDWELSAARLSHVIRHVPEAFAPKHRWAMDWYYPVLAEVMAGEEGRARMASRYEGFVMDEAACAACPTGPGSPPPRRASALAQLAVGNRAEAEALFGWAQQYRTDDGRYWTGTVFPAEARFPAGERSTYTASAVVLAADSLSGGSPASGLFTAPRRPAPGGVRRRGGHPGGRPLGRLTRRRRRPAARGGRRP